MMGTVNVREDGSVGTAAEDHRTIDEEDLDLVVLHEHGESAQPRVAKNFRRIPDKAESLR